jgi:transposase
MHTGCAPLPVSSGKSTRHRLNRCGNRRLNSTVHVIAVTQARMHPPAIAYMERKQAGGMSYREALRCLKRHIVRAVFKTMVKAEQAAAGQLLPVEFVTDSVAMAV